METPRRTVLKALSAGAVSSTKLLRAAASTVCSGTGEVSTFENYSFAFFTPREQELAGRLMELIIPADEHSRGALAARVPAFADRMLSTGSERTKTAWRAGLAAFGDASGSLSLEAVLEKAAAEEDNPKTELGRFFVDLKRMTVDGYYTSEIGIQEEMRYEGNRHLMAAPKCEHPEHGAG